MKQLKSSLRDLREVFERGITVKDIAEPFASFDAERGAAEVRRYLDEKDFDVVGVRRNGSAVGYAERAALSDGSLGDHQRTIDSELVLPAMAPLLRALETLLESPRFFVEVLGEVGGIVTRGDLQKAPVRMWLFGVISLIEMQMLRVIRERYPEDKWKHPVADMLAASELPPISAKRLKKAEQILLDRRKRNEAIDLADCLQFGDKADILLREDTRPLGFESPEEAGRFFRELQDLRNELAHSQDIVSGNRPSTVALVRTAEDVLLRLENLGAEGEGR